MDFKAGQFFPPLYIIRPIHGVTLLHTFEIMIIGFNSLRLAADCCHRNCTCKSLQCNAMQDTPHNAATYIDCTMYPIHCVCACVCDVIKMAEATRSLEKTSNSFALLDLCSSVPPYHHTPWGLSSWQLDWIGLRIPLQPLVATVADPPGSPRQPVLRPWRPAATHPRVFRRGPGQPTLQYFLGLQTGPRLLPGPCPTPLLGQGVPRRRRCVCVCVCVCVILY